MSYFTVFFLNFIYLFKVLENCKIAAVLCEWGFSVFLILGIFSFVIELYFAQGNNFNFTF